MTNKEKELLARCDEVMRCLATAAMFDTVASACYQLAWEKKMEILGEKPQT